MPLSVSPSEMSGSSSSCDIHYRPLPPIRKRRVRSMLVQKIEKSKNGRTNESNSIRPNRVCACVCLTNNVHAARKYKIENHC